MQFKIEGKILKQESIELNINNNFKNKELTNAQNLIHLITNIRNKIIYEYDNLIYISGACLFKNPSIAHCIKCIFFKMASECQGDINNADFSFREDPPFLKIKYEQFSPETNKILKQLFEFIIRLRDYKILIKKIDKETPKLMYIIFENNNKISKENLDKINKGIALFKDLGKLRSNIIIEYKNQINDLLLKNKEFINQINKIGNIAYLKNIKDIYEITMLYKNNISESDFENNNMKEDWVIYNSIKEAKKMMQEKLKEEKVEDIEPSLLTFSLQMFPNFDSAHEDK